jgi:hypothetical protein
VRRPAGTPWRRRRFEEPTVGLNPIVEDAFREIHDSVQLIGGRDIGIPIYLRAAELSNRKDTAS